MKEALESGKAFQRALAEPVQRRRGQAAACPSWARSVYPRPVHSLRWNLVLLSCCGYQIRKALPGRLHLCAPVQTELSLTPSSVYWVPLPSPLFQFPVCPPRPHSSLWGRGRSLFCQWESQDFLGDLYLPKDTQEASGLRTVFSLKLLRPLVPGWLTLWTASPTPVLRCFSRFLLVNNSVV